MKTTSRIYKGESRKITMVPTGEVKTTYLVDEKGVVYVQALPVFRPERDVKKNLTELFHQAYIDDLLHNDMDWEEVPPKQD